VPTWILDLTPVLQCPPRAPLSLLKDAMIAVPVAPAMQPGLFSRKKSVNQPDTQAFRPD
jgi:hypothetical protein